MVVCDGVSSSVNPEAAASVAAHTTAQALQHQPQHQNPYQAIEAAIHQAQVAVSNLAPVAPDNPPSTTIVAALVEPNQPRPTATIGWIGDSRAYWVSPTETKLLTEDDSWLNWIRHHGQPPDNSIFDYPGAANDPATSFQNLDDFAKSPYAHAITRWLGAQKSSTHPTHDTNPVPSIVQVPLDQDGFLILCSDGLWNYASQPDRLFKVFAGHAEEDALTIAQDLVDHALRCGGRDNVSVAVFHQSSR
jgi:PPM family protein phosphatase